MFCYLLEATLWKFLTLISWINAAIFVKRIPLWSRCRSAVSIRRLIQPTSVCAAPACTRFPDTAAAASHFPPVCHLELPARSAALCSSSVLIIMQIFDYLLRKITASSFRKCSVFISSTHIRGRLKLSMWSVNHPALLTVCSACVPQLMMGLGCVFVMRLRL